MIEEAWQTVEPRPHPLVIYAFTESESVQAKGGWYLGSVAFAGLTL